MCYGIIYKIENKINGKIYIGQTTKKSFDERYKGDIRNTHNKHLKKSIEKCGIENFYIDKCVCTCETKEELDRVEKFYIYVYNTMDPKCGYNMREGGNGGKLSNETKQKISEAKKGENNYWYGKCFSEEHKQKLSESHKGENSHMWGKHHSEETKKKMSEAQKRRAIIQLDKNGNFIKKWDCARQAGKELNIRNITTCCKGYRKTAGSYKWVYEEDYKKLNV